MPEDPPGTQVFCKVTESSECILMAHPTGVKNIMPVDNPQVIIAGIREALGDNQALIEVKSVRTDNYGYVYSIVKTLMEPSGVNYTLTLDIVKAERAVHLQGFFNEAGMTGIRDTVVLEIEHRNNNVTGNLEGWLKDPYDENIKRDYLMNLSEYEKYDEMFPDHPLSVLRTFIKGLRIL